TIEFIEALSKSIFAIAVARYLRDQHVTSGGAIALRLREGPYQGGKIVVVDKPAQRLYVGQPVFVVIDAGARWGRILSLQINGRPVEVVAETAPTIGVGIGLDFMCPRDGMLYALEDDDDVVWSPVAAAA